MIRVVPTLLVAAVVAAIGAPPVLAHSRDPMLGGSLWTPNQGLGFQWESGHVPPAALQSAVLAAASDNNGSRLSRAATLGYASTGIGRIAYAVDVDCAAEALACTYRWAPTGFRVTIREHGHVFRWGVLRWCQLLTTPWPDGCMDLENIALHEFGHVQILDHHAMYADASDYLDAVMEATARAKPTAGWNVHTYRRCDVATLQRTYDVPSWSTKYSTCDSIATTLSLTPSTTTLWVGQSLTFTAALTVAVSSAYDQLSGNPLAGRTVALQRRPVGTTGWTTVASGATTTSGAYTTTQSPTATYEWRAVFSQPPDEGLLASTSPTVTVTVRSCTSSPCPSLVRGR